MTLPMYTKSDDLEAGPDHQTGVEKLKSDSLIAEQHVFTTAPPKETIGVSLFFWIAVNTLATIAIVFHSSSFSTPSLTFNPATYH